MDNFRIEDGEFSKCFVPCSYWEDSFTDYININNIIELEINEGKGFEGEDVDFLKKLPNLKVLKYLNWGIDDLSPINNLTSLKYLTLDSYDKSEIDFTKFPKLEDCFIEWRPKAKSIFQCKSLKYLHIEHFKGKSTEKLSELTNLETLKIGNSPINDLGGLEKLLRTELLSTFISNCFSHQYDIFLPLSHTVIMKITENSSNLS